MLFLFAMLLTIPAQGKTYAEKSEQMQENRKGKGQFTILVKPDSKDEEDPDYFFNDDQYGNDDHDTKFCNKFYSKSFFDNGKGKWCYEFYFEQWNDKTDWGDEEDRVCSDTEVLVQNNSGTWNTIGTIKNDEKGEVDNKESSWGLLEKSDDHVYRFYPSPQLIDGGFKAIKLQFRYFLGRHAFGHATDMYFRLEVTKSRSQGLDVTYTPMPLQVQCTTDQNGYLNMNVSKVPGHSKKVFYDWRYRRSDASIISRSTTADVSSDSGWNSGKDANTINATDAASRIHLSPFYRYTIFLRGGMETDAPDNNTYTWYNPYNSDNAWGESVVDAYVYPKVLQFKSFNQWDKTVTLSWTAETSVQDFTTNKVYSRSKNGKWFIYRKDFGASNSSYTQIGNLPGDTENLSFTDAKVDYDKQYTYCVVFLPNVMQDDKRNISELLQWFEKELQPTDSVSTNRAVEVNLQQIADPDVSGIKLEWTYDIQQTGSKFFVQRRPSGADSSVAWDEVTDMNVDVSQSKVTFVDKTPQSVCDIYDYRIYTTTLGTSFFSNELTKCSITSGTRITSFDVTKGTESNQVVVKWTVLQKGQESTTFDIERRRITNGVPGDWAKVGDVSGTASEYTYRDANVEAGSYYEYRVLIENKDCETGESKYGGFTSIGYSQSRGTITGHVSYGTGTSVSDVRLNLIKSGTDSNDSDLQRQFSSIRISGNNTGGLSWKPDSARYAAKLTSNNPLSFQLWIAPEANKDNLPIVSFNKDLSLSLKKNGPNDYDLIFSGDGSTTVVGQVPALHFTHVTAIYDGAGKWRFILNGDLDNAQTTQRSGSWILKDSLHVGADKNNAFNGLLDDIRLWSRALSDKDVATNYNRVLGGTENGMEFYWPMDEGIKGNTFDVSRQNGIFNCNHPTVAPNAEPSSITPSDLKLYGLTDVDGNYIIRGIPFDEGGTNYKLLPEFGIHEFQPSSRSLYVSPSSLTANNVDFTDRSSFPMRGYIYYKDTNIPVKGIYLYIDGELVTSGGKVAQTDADGYYEISVPIGKHFIEAKQTGHHMVNAGRWPTSGTYDFQAAVHQNFTDSTLVNFCGRVAGGEIQDAKPVGFGKSLNNIGTATIRLSLNNPNFSFNCEEGTKNANDQERIFLAQNPDTIKSRTWAGAKLEEQDNTSFIYISTDPKTGEFSAMLPPLKYRVDDISIPTNPDVAFTDLKEIDMTNVIAIQVDTLFSVTNNADNDSIVIAYDLYKYNQKMVSTWYAQPQLEITETSDSLHIGYYGMQYWRNYEDEFGKVDSIEIWNATNGLHYDYDYPVFRMGDTYSFRIKGYEEYINYDSGSPVKDYVPMSSQVLTVNNELSDNQAIVTEDLPDKELKQGDVYMLKSNQLALDDNGEFIYQWNAGLPNPTAPYTRHLGITYSRHRRTCSQEVFDAYVFGSLPLGNNFVTKGPDQVLMVLRDPPGSNSYTSWTSGKVTTEIETSVNNGFDFGIGVNFEVIYGKNLTQADGIGVSIVTSNDIANKINVGGEFELSYNKTNSTVYTVSSTETVSTSADPEFVGANGDVYIGTSTNLLIGNCKKVGFFRETMNSDFVVKDSVAMCMSDSITTAFKYTQSEIENKQIPEWKKMRASILTSVDSKEDAESFPNPGKDPIYVTWQDKFSDEWIEGTNYRVVYGTDSTTVRVDSVQYLTSQIDLWRQVMAANEEDKVLTMEYMNEVQSDSLRNISFDSGTSYNYTERNDTTETKTRQVDYAVGLLGDVALGLELKALEHFGLNITIKGKFKYKGNVTIGSPDDNYTNTAEFSYHFADSSFGSDYTVNIYNSKCGWSDFFSVLGGQTYCPYEGEVRTKYYKPGEKVLSNATEAMQNPQIRISNGAQNPSSHAVISDVAAGESALFTLTLTNDTEIDGAMTYVLGVKDDTNSQGLQFSVDGSKISGGRSFVVEAGQSITKTLEVKQTDVSVLDYENICLTFASDCQNDISSINGVVRDSCTLDVHFKPSSSPVTLKTGSYVVNTANSGTLKLTLTDFNRAFQGLKSMGVEYKADGDVQWNRVQRFVFAQADSTEQGDIVVPATGDVSLLLDMSDNNSYPDRTYIFRAYTETPYGNEGIRVYSDEVSVVKDMHLPTAIGTPQPADGILHAGDDIVLEFNEDIIPGYVNASNVLVTGKVNKQPTTHEVSLHLSGDDPTASTSSDFYMQGNSTVAMWLKYTQPGTLFTHCTGDNQFKLAIDADNHLTVTTNNTTQTAARLTLPKDEWMYLVYAFNKNNSALDILVQYGTQTDSIRATFSGARSMNQVVYANDKRLFLGGDALEADIHDLRIYGICRNPLEVATEKYSTSSIYTSGLMAHWPMDEGQGTKARDLRNDAHPLLLTAADWHIDGTNYAATVDANKQQHLDLSIASATTDYNESYVLEFWFKADGDMKGKTLFQAGNKYANNLRLFTHTDGTLYFQYDVNIKPVAPEGFDINGGWHHFALNVMRGISASVAIDGKRTAVFTETEVPPLEGARIVMGAGYELPVFDNYTYKDCMTGAFDEVRIWKGVLKPEVVQANMYQCVDTVLAAVQGLTAYYPMEATVMINNVETKAPSDKDMAPGQIMAGSITGNFDLNAFTLNAPPLRSAPEVQTVINSTTVSDRKVFLQLQPVSMAEIEGTTLDFTVTEIFDRNGNKSQPITWQAYIHQNTLSWGQDSVTCIKNYGDASSFQVDIVNSGKATEYYTISGLPTWLTTDNAQGEVAPESRQAIRFDVLPTAAVGTYDVNLTLTGNNEIAEPLRLVLKVKGMAPDWAVADDAGYDEQMNLVGQVIIDGFVNENPESRLAAFIDTRCVGVAQPEKARGSYFVPMTIYGTEKDSGKDISFKFWDASTGTIYVALNTDLYVQFYKDSVKGSYSHPVVLTNTDELEQNIDVAAGWNWISTYVQPDTLLPLTSVLVADGFLQGDIIKDKNNASYYDGAAWSSAKLNTIQPATMYKLCVQQPLSIVIQGAECKPSQTPVNINPRWNWIGFIPQSAMQINYALAGSGAAQGDYIKSKSQFAIYGPYGWEGNLKTLEPGKGYMYFSQAPQTITFHYPEVTDANRARAAVKSKAPEYYFQPVGSENYPDNMSVVLQLIADGQPLDTCEVAAFIDNECRATAKADDGLYYLMIQGEGSGQPIELRTIYQDQVIVIDQSLAFRSDENVGLPWNPYTIDLDRVTSVREPEAQPSTADAKYFLPNGIQVQASNLRKGQVYIRVDKNGNVTKYRK